MLDDKSANPVAFRDAFRTWLRIGLLSFGGPAGQIALMHRVLVDEKKWISEARFLHALNYCMLLPGPEAQQLAVYVGWLLHRTLGGLVAGILFVLPGALVILILSVLYAGFRDLTLVQALFFGIKAAVLAVVIEAVIRIGKRALKNAAMYSIAASSFIAIFFLDAPFPLIVIAAAVIGFFGGRKWPGQFVVISGHGAASSGEDSLDGQRFAHTKPSLARAVTVTLICLFLWLAPIAALWSWLGADDVFVKEGLFFSKMAVVTFGGAYAVLAYVAQQAVEAYNWLAPGEMLDGLGMAETTPGPLIMVVQFVGFMGAFRNPGTLDPMVAGVIGSVLTTWVTFVPCFLWIFLGAPYIETLRGKTILTAMLSAITAAVVGVILNLSVWFGLHVVFDRIVENHAFWFRLLVPEWATIDPVSAILTAAALVMMLRFKVGMIPTLATTASLGMAYVYLTG
ncbi:MAG: chromate efflux transporter [Alphaproteobacteria bacterium]|nr:chromate efflux transporter [Alphaproteobacteria bacterium]